MWPNPDYQLDFAQPSFAWQRYRWPGGLLVAVLLAGVVTASNELAALHARTEQLAQRQQQRALQLPKSEKAELSQQAKGQPRAPVVALSATEQKAAATMLQQLNVRWFDLLQALESQQVPEVALLQLLPDANRGQFVLSGEAKSYQVLLEYVSHLQTMSALSQVHLLKHQVNESHPQRPVSFEIQGGWQP